ncbi:histidine-rich glycoprotein-like [Mytilus californianus]|uniref:histidine-rich glycoprotein-like n=1 Tax=Mytilus californianus TaxID=6549 RepID=UPI0022481D14|nr:histidine-rich glycoprotein-like [Mytilus californianus]
MAQWICVLLLVVVTAVVTSGYNSYGGYPPKIARPDVYNSYPVHNHVVIHHRGVVDPGYYRHPGMGSYLKKYHGFKIRHGRFSYNGIGHTHGGHYESRKYYKFHSHGHGHGYRHGHGDGYSHGLIHGVSNYSYYKKYHKFRIQHHRFSYGGKAFKLTCHRKRFFKLWNDCFTHHHSRSYCFGFLRKQHLFVTYGAGHHGYTSHGAGYGHGQGYHGQNNIYKHLNLHKKIDTHHVQRIHHTANSHVSAISHLSNIHVRNIQYEANKHVSRISDEANKHINKFRQLVNHHINRLHKQAKHHLSAVDYQHKRHLSESEYQKKRHLAKKEHLHKKHEYYLSKHHSMVDYGYDQGHVVTYLDYYKKYHGFRIDHDRFSYGGKAYTLKCESKQFYSLWSDCWSQYHSRSTCFANLRKQHLFIDYPGDHADPYTPTKIVLEAGDDYEYKK